MAIKAVFIGNLLGGDDGVAPVLYRHLKEDKRLNGVVLLEMGVIGLDLLSYVDENDTLVIVDAVRAKDHPGEVVLLGEDDLSDDLFLVSQHDFGVEQTSKMLRAYMPGIKEITVIGIRVKDINAFSDKLSHEIGKKLPEIKERVVEELVKIRDVDARGG